MSVAQRTAAVHDLVIVTDRLPTSWSDTCAPRFEPPMPSALRAGFWPLLNARRGAWVGWSGLPAADPRTALFDMVGTRCAEVPFSTVDVAEHLRGHSDAALWPLYHDALDRPTFNQRWWQAYQRVNQRYARTAADLAAPAGHVWVHGYQLQLVPAMLRATRPDLRIGFHLDTPFPPYQLLASLPTSMETVNGFLGADAVGFEDGGSARNLARLCAETPGMIVDDDHIVAGNRLIRYGAAPTGVDATEIARVAGLRSVQSGARQLRSQLGDPQSVLLAVDRMDTSSGIEQRLAAFDALLHSRQLDRGTTVLIQVVLPDAEPTTARARLRSRIEQQIARINGRHSRLGGAVVHYVHQGHNLGERVTLYLASDVFTVTALRAGTSLAAKEYLAARVDGFGALVLSELTGAASELPDAYLTNPYDAEGLQAAVATAVRAPAPERIARMHRLRRMVWQHDVHKWAGACLASAASPVVEAHT